MESDHTEAPQIPDYELLKPIGRGSYGEVWLARSVTGVFRVIKIVRRSRFQDERPFLRELEGITRFQSAASGRPRQLALLHVGRNDEKGYFFYVMEPADDAESGSAIDPETYVPLTLKELFLRRGRLPPAECVQLALELARGLAVLHAAGLIHRDIKPSNVIFVQRTPKLADVGLVASTDATLTGVGTPGYIPPEGPGTTSADIYSLGKVLYELATGLDRMAFPRIPRELADDPDARLLSEINSVVLKACATMPHERHPDADAFIRDLEVLQAGRSLIYYEERRVRLRALAFVTGGLAILALIAATLLGWRSRVMQRANEEARRALYRSDLPIAQFSRAEDDLGRARTALQRQIPKLGQTDLRGLEWAILTHASRADGAPLQPVANGKSIRALACDPSGRWVAASIQDEKGVLWDLHTGHIQRTLDNLQVLGGFLADSRLVLDEPNRVLRIESPLTGTAEKIDTGRRLRQLLPDGRALLVSPSGDFVYQIFDIPTRQILSEYNVSKHFPDFDVASVSLDPSGKTLALGLFKQAGASRQRWLASFDLNIGRENWRTQTDQRLIWLRSASKSNCFVANIGGLAAVLYDFRSSSSLRTFHGHTARALDASFSPDGRWFASAGADSTIRVWELDSTNNPSVLRGMSRPVTSLAWLPGAHHLVAGDDAGNIRVFSIPSESPPETLYNQFNDIHGDLVFREDGRVAAVTKTTNSISLFSTRDLHVHSILTNLFQPIAFSDDGMTLTAFDKDWALWRTHLVNGSQEFLAKPLPTNFLVTAWSLSPDLSRIAMSGKGGHVAIISVKDGRTTMSSEPESKDVWAMVFSHDSREVWVGNSRGDIIRLSAVDGRRIDLVTKADPEVQAMALSPDGRWVAVSFFTTAGIRIWDTKHRTWSDELVGHRRFVQALTFTPDGNRLISAGADGRTVFWRVPGFEELLTLELPRKGVLTGDEGIAILRLSRGASAMAALTEDGRVQLWRAD